MKVLRVNEGSMRFSLCDPNREKPVFSGVNKKLVQTLSRTVGSQRSAVKVVDKGAVVPIVPLGRVDGGGTEDTKVEPLKRQKLKPESESAPRDVAVAIHSQITMPLQGPVAPVIADQYGSNDCFVGSSLSQPSGPAPASGSAPVGFVRRPYSVEEAQKLLERSSIPGPYAEDLSEHLRAHAKDPLKHPLDPSLVRFLSQAFSGKWDRDVLAAPPSLNQAFNEVQKHHGMYLLDLNDARGREIIRLDAAIQGLEQEKGDLLKHLETAARKQDGYVRELEAMRKQVSELSSEVISKESELCLSQSACKEKDCQLASRDQKILELRRHIDGEEDRTALFSRQHMRRVFRDFGVRPPFYDEGANDFDAFLESDKGLIPCAYAKQVVAQLKVAMENGVLDLAEVEGEGNEGDVDNEKHGYDLPEGNPSKDKGEMVGVSEGVKVPIQSAGVSKADGSPINDRDASIPQSSIDVTPRDDAATKEVVQNV